MRSFRVAALGVAFLLTALIQPWQLLAQSQAPAPAMRFTGRMAPENNTAGKHNIGRASVAWATFPTIAEVSKPKPRAAMAQSSRPTPIDA